jgi:NAD(P)-dependent dehydrogenase (short-subunit alcohol dehydrogenase family)
VARAQRLCRWQWRLIGSSTTLLREFGELRICVAAILPCAIPSARPLQTFQGRDPASSRKVAKQQAPALTYQSIKRFVDPADFAALAVFQASDVLESIFGQPLPTDEAPQFTA